MNTDDENNPAVCVELAGLTEGLRSWLSETLDGEALQMLFDFVETHQENARRKGINFPKMVALVIPRLGHIKLVRADLTEINRRRAVISLLRECPSANREEVARAVKRAWPHVGTSTLIDEAEFKIGQTLAQLEGI